MKTIVNKKAKKNNSKQTSEAKSTITQEKILNYCGYKLIGNKLVATGNYNPVPYQGLQL